MKFWNSMKNYDFFIQVLQSKTFQQSNGAYKLNKILFEIRNIFWFSELWLLRRIGVKFNLEYGVLSETIVCPFPTLYNTFHHNTARSHVLDIALIRPS